MKDTLNFWRTDFYYLRFLVFEFLQSMLGPNGDFQTFQTFPRNVRFCTKNNQNVSNFLFGIIKIDFSIKFKFFKII